MTGLEPERECLNCPSDDILDVILRAHDRTVPVRERDRFPSSSLGEMDRPVGVRLRRCVPSPAFESLSDLRGARRQLKKESKRAGAVRGIDQQLALPALRERPIGDHGMTRPEKLLGPLRKRGVGPSRRPSRVDTLFEGSRPSFRRTCSVELLPDPVRREDASGPGTPQLLGNCRLPGPGEATDDQQNGRTFLASVLAREREQLAGIGAEARALGRGDLGVAGRKCAHLGPDAGAVAAVEGNESPELGVAAEFGITVDQLLRQVAPPVPGQIHR